jgi:hypothetical protein
MHVNEQVLHKKGWTAEEIGHVRLKFLKLEKEKDGGQRLLDQFIFWLLVFLALATNAGVSYAFLPLIAIISDASIAGILALTGIAFGMLFSSLLREHDHQHPIRAVIACGVLIIGSLLLFGYAFKGAMTDIDHFLLVLAFLGPYAIPFVVKVKHGTR